MEYRREIDGLRAVAVLPVILFHAGFEMFSGGFVGVDVFFVISGFLITGILIEELARGDFSIARFYERRARRILPALFVVLFACFPFAWMWMLPSELKDFAESVAATVLFSSNILFWSESGYFDTAAELKPLLHTWSLAVEEQYYLLFPLLLLAFWKFGRARVLTLIVAIAAFSLLGSEYGSRNHPSANFFLAPTRAWELLAGSICAFLTARRAHGSNDVLAMAGLALIVFPMLHYDRNTPFPSVHALAPVGGTALVLLYAHRETLVARLLSTGPLVGIGLISYGAYLWHQPLFAFARIRSPGEPSQALMGGLAIASLLLAILTWKYVEQPFRKRSRSLLPTRKGAFLASASLGSLLVLVGIVFAVDPGKAERLMTRASAPVSLLQSNFIVIGDSHAEHLLSGLQNITTGTVENRTSSGCIPFRDVDRYDSRSRKGECAKFINAALNEIISRDPDAVLVLSSMGPVYLDGTTFKGKDEARVTGLGVELISDKAIADHWEIYETGMRRTFGELSKLRNAKVIFAIDVPELGIDSGCRRPWISLSDCYVDRAEFEQRTSGYRSLVYSIASDYPRIAVFDPTSAFCNEEVCSGYRKETGYLYRDADHLSEEGSLYFSMKLAEWMKGRPF